MSKSEEVNTSSAESDSDDEPLAKVCSSPLYYITEATIIKESNINSNGGQYKKEFLLLEWHVNFISVTNRSINLSRQLDLSGFHMFGT